MDTIFRIILFIAAVLFAYLYFLKTNKSDKDNRDAVLEQFKVYDMALKTLSGRIRVLESARQSNVSNIEILDSIKLVSEEQAKIRDFTVNLAQHVSQLRPVHRHYYAEKKST